MPNDKVLSLPLESEEVIQVILQRIEKRLRSDCYLHPATTYNGFSYDFALNLRLRDTNFGKDTLIWDQHAEGKTDDLKEMDQEHTAEKFDSGDSPNKLRIDHDLAIPVQTQEGKNIVIKKRKFPKEETSGVV